MLANRANPLFEQPIPQTLAVVEVLADESGDFLSLSDLIEANTASNISKERTSIECC